MFTCVLGRYVASTVFLLVPRLSEGADSVDGQLRGDKEYVPLQWRNQFWQSLEEGTGKCRKAMPGFWRKVPESDARSLEEGGGKVCQDFGGRSGKRC